MFSRCFTIRCFSFITLALGVAFQVHIHLSQCSSEVPASSGWLSSSHLENTAEPVTPSAAFLSIGNMNMPWAGGRRTWQNESSDEDITSSVIAGTGFRPPVMRIVHDDLVIEAATAIVDLAREERAIERAMASANVESVHEYTVSQEEEDRRLSMQSLEDIRNRNGRPRKSARLSKALPYLEVRARLLVSWVKIILLEPKASDAGRRMADSPESAHSDIAACYVSDKANATLAARLGSIANYVQWARGSLAALPLALDYTFWPPSVNSCCQYVNDGLVEAAATSVSRFVESVTFMAFTFMFSTNVKKIGENRYLMGKGQVDMQKLGPRKQAKPWDFDELASMEAAVYNRTYSDVVTMVMGATCHLCYLRARVNDLARILRYERFEDFYEIESDGAKTAKKDRLPVVFVGPLETVSGLDWSGSYSSFRDEMGVPLHGGALFPSIINGQWVNSQATTGDINQLIRQCADVIGVPNADKLSSHSGKCTFLNAASIYGIDKDSRFRLGYHMVASERSVNCYSRENVLEPVRKLAGLIADARAGRFDPAKGRKKPAAQAASSSSAKPIMVDVANQRRLRCDLDEDVREKDYEASACSNQCKSFDELQHRVEAEHDDQLPSDPEDEEEESTSTGFCPAEITTMADLDFAENAMRVFKGNDKMYLTKDRIHCGRKGDPSITNCGNFISETFQLMSIAVGDETVEFGTPLCKRCYGRDERQARTLARRASEPLLSNLVQDQEFMTHSHGMTF